MNNNTPSRIAAAFTLQSMANNGQANGGTDIRLVPTPQIKLDGLPNFSGASTEWRREFLANLEEAAVWQGLGESLDSLVPAMSQILKGEAKDWWLDAKDEIRTWANFKTEFQGEYLSSLYLERIEEDLNRLDLEHCSSASSYILRKMALFRELGTKTEEQKIRSLVRGCPFRYQTVLSSTDKGTLSTVKTRIKELWDLEQSERARRERQDPVRVPTYQQQPTGPLVCFRCREPGHFARECPKSNRY